MKHARPDYDRIQDPLNLIPKEEPVFVLRSQDAVAAATVRIWAILHRLNGGADDIAKLACTFADEMDKWPIKKSADL